MSLVVQLPALQIVVTLMAAPVCVLLRRASWVWPVALAANVVAALVAWALLAEVLENGTIRLLASPFRINGTRLKGGIAPELGADTEDLLG